MLPTSCPCKAAIPGASQKPSHKVSQSLLKSLTVTFSVCPAVPPPCRNPSSCVEGPPFARPSPADGHWAVCTFWPPRPTRSFWAVGETPAFASGHTPRRDQRGHVAVPGSASWAAAGCGPRPARRVEKPGQEASRPTHAHMAVSASPAGSVQPWSKVPSWCRPWAAGHMPVLGSVLSCWVKVSECILEKRRTPTRTGCD